MFAEENGLKKKTLHYCWLWTVLGVNGQIYPAISEEFVLNI